VVLSHKQIISMSHLLTNQLNRRTKLSNIIQNQFFFFCLFTKCKGLNTLNPYNIKRQI